jgi:8-oxo-dGTP diphosphatase
MNHRSDQEHLAYMQTLHKRVASVALLLENTVGELLIVKSSYKKHWTAPGGVIDEGETPLQAVVRETKEEIGVAVDPKSVSFVAVVMRSGPVFDTYQFIFKAALPESETIALQPEEIAEYDFITREQATANDRYYGEIIHTWALGRTGYIEQAFESQQE